MSGLVVEARPVAAKRLVSHDVSLVCLQRALFIGTEPPWAIRTRLELEGIDTFHARSWAVARDFLAEERPAIVLAEPDVGATDMVGVLLGLLGGEGPRVGLVHDVCRIPMLLVPLVPRAPGVVLYADRPADEVSWADLPAIAAALARHVAPGDLDA